MPRSTFDYASAIIAGSANIRDASYLFRHVQLNPADSYIPKNDRQRLSIIISAKAAEFESYEKERVNLAMREGQAAVASGATDAKPLDFKESTDKDGHRVMRANVTIATPSTDNLGAVLTDGQKQHIVSLDAMPMSRLANARRFFMLRDLGVATVHWFCSMGVCSVVDAEAIYEDMVLHDKQWIMDESTRNPRMPK